MHKWGRIGVGAILGGAAALHGGSAEAATACDPQALTCSVATAPALSAKTTTRLPTEVDSGWMSKTIASVAFRLRTRFTLDPVGQDPLASLDMSKGALVEATWTEKGFLDLRPIVRDGGEGALSVRFTLAPSIEAEIAGANVAYNAVELVNRIPGAQFAFDAAAQAPMSPWGFTEKQVQVVGPALDGSTIFSVPFTTLGISTDYVEGTFALRATTSPTFRYATKEVKLDGVGITKADGSARVAARDVDAMDVSVLVSGELAYAGAVSVGPALKLDWVGSVPTFGATYTFDAVSTPYSGAMPIAFQRVMVHVPLPNVKVSDAPVQMGMVAPGETGEQTVNVTSTGEMRSKMTFESSDPQFVVTSDVVQLGRNENYGLKVQFKPTSSGPASANITMRSNDPDAPEQVFRVAANGAPLNPESPDSAGGANGEEASEGGCAVVSSRSTSGSALSFVGALAAVATILRRVSRVSRGGRGRRE